MSPEYRVEIIGRHSSSWTAFIAVDEKHSVTVPAYGQDQQLSIRGPVSILKLTVVRKWVSCLSDVPNG
jgi:hypothetical protein